MLEIDTNRRPDVNKILSMPFIQKRIQGFLNETVMKDEFSHTVLHKQNVFQHKPANADALKQKAEKSYVLKDFKINNVYNNIDFENFELIEKENAKSILKINTNKKIILFGANNPQLERKGWKIFLQTLKKIDKSKYFLIIFGKFWSNKILEDIGIEYKSFGNVSDQKFLNLIYSSSDMFIAASIQEAFGKTWAEAMACGLPIVCFKETSAAEIVEHKLDGYVVNEIDESKLLEGINWLASSHDHSTNRDRIRNKAKMFEAQKVANNYIEIYKSCLNNV